MGAKLVREMASPHLSILWDPGNCLYANEPAFPDGWEALKGGAMGHLHIKDAIVEMNKATVTFWSHGPGTTGGSFEPWPMPSARMAMRGWSPLKASTVTKREVLREAFADRSKPSRRSLADYESITIQANR